MPNLRPGEKMQRCESIFHERIRRQKYYIKRTYYNELEQHFCPGCCSLLMHTRGILKYTIGEGYVPTGILSIKTILNSYMDERYVTSGR